MLRVLIGLMLLLPFGVSAQDCDCAASFAWVKTTFEENDAGFAYVLERKGEDLYHAYTASFAERVKSITEPSECYSAIYEWMTFFRDGHIAIIPNENDDAGGNNGAPKSDDDEIIAKFKDWERVTLDAPAFEKKLMAKTAPDYEGIWVSGNYRIAIEAEGEGYVGSILAADGVYWQPGQVKLRIAPDNSSVYYMLDHSAREIEQTTLLGNNTLQFGTIQLQREYPEFEELPVVASYRRAITTDAPYLERIDDKTLYLRIPSFAYEEKVLIDSVLKSNHDLITSTENLIIDIRYGTGGSDQAYYGILPLIYTQPIRSVGVEFLSTELNNSRMLAFANDTEYGFDEETKQWARSAYEKLAARPGEFVNIDTTDVSIQTYDQVHEFPKNVGIIMHDRNGSTDEEFLLAARQSRKVKLFGTSTQGVLDISNMMFIPSPCDDFQLGYSLSRSLRIPELAIDGMGIQPDCYLDSSIPEYEWVEYVRGVLGE